MIVKIYPSKISGIIKAPQSKSLAIRLIFLSLFTRVYLHNLVLSEDVIDAIKSVRALGVKVKNNSEFIPPEKLEIKERFIKLKGSATTLRMLIPILAAIGGEVTIDADESLRRRPLNRIVQALSNYGISFSSYSLPLTITGKLSSNEIKISGDESSQYISGLIYALHILNGGSIEILPPISSKSYILLTIDLFKRFGSDVKFYGSKIHVNPNNLVEFQGEVAGDYGLASFYALSALVSGGGITITNLWEPKEYFGDHSIVKIFSEMGASSEYKDGRWFVKAKDKYSPIKIDIDDAPDLAMTIAGLSAIAEGTSEIIGIERLRIKESDRIESIRKILGLYGVGSEVKYNSILIFGINKGMLNSPVTDCLNDHRVAMMSSALALVNGGVITSAECVGKSNPNYWQDLLSLNAKISIE
ncbi:3-phosphoshikimate 1-carboxyvinyltransferase [Saccharolobus solfataricus]|uniref:3-phosphoshikimate 1-carboxyvinyltransferase n=3 Tax=Saccharolobus solfataricus TaxID=2287 RepID=AROA_SACS2|nr:3-phosphoshikimate 1-carboxyvinyltransferase [Saccharolobus solfataricus]Q980I5.1 RecName: Full=3-phosphoshikimate 1-carboxyvinyltransferase; AltName: Full=5-enolpyruvylshikimate-3-phosphate synthase; Short=EPSP synthase; Short=EPSPS [Saccharolobus solfataricus P2]AAK40646.1 3-phosphoshikimate 1-carboxyvinyltransferase (5-enolpyruvylshikimate-3-phosphate synthase)(EPSP synthase) (aroA) [Saccharolobus solfataricus P2]AKA73621.1 3-phosphoshikimate 1-carboxyvinyltransferase [Saccharolobus solfat